MRALIAAMCFGAVVFTAPSLWALQEEETKAESQPETSEASDAKADDKKAADKDDEAKDDEKKKTKAEEDAEAEKKKKDEVKENADAAQAELEKAEAAPAPAPAVEVAPETPVAAPAVVVAPAPMVVAPVTEQADAALSVEEDTEAEEEKAAWAGSSVSWGLNTDLATLIPSLNEDWNETVKTSIKLKPSWVLNKQYSLSGNIGFTCEFTTPGSAAGSTSVRRCSVSNTTIALSLGELYNIWDTSIRGRASLTLPTDIYTVETGGLFGVSAGVSATRSIKELDNLSLTYSLGFSHDARNRFFGGDTADEYSSERVVPNRISESPLPDYVPQGYDYSPAILVGFSNSLSASYKANDWLSLSGSFGFEHALLESAIAVDLDGQVEGGISENIVQLTGNDTLWRIFLSYSLAASFKIPQVPYLSVSTGLAWFQKAPHFTGSYVAPFRPKDTSIFLNLSFNAAKLMDELL